MMNYSNFVGRGTIELTTNILWNRPSVPRSIARVLKYFGQMRAERVHGRVRRLTLAEDYRMNEILEFSGRE
jgi:hypothetical protein